MSSSSSFSLLLLSLINHSTLIFYPSFLFSLVISLSPITKYHSLNSFVLFYSFLELIFHLLFIHRSRSLRITQPTLQHLPRPSPELRRSILLGILTSFESTHQLRQTLLGWFYRPHQPFSSTPLTLASLQTDNVADLLAYIFFSSRLDGLTPAELAQIDSDLLIIQSAIRHEFPRGRDPSIEPMAHTLQPIQAEHRPLFLYLAIELARFLVDLVYRALGFRRFSIPITPNLAFQYWFHPGWRVPPASPPPSPVILVAGIVGLISMPHYAAYLLWTSKRSMFLVGNQSVSLTLLKPDFELIPVNQSSHSSGSKNDSKRTMYRRRILTLSEQSNCLLKMLKIHGFQVKVGQNKQLGGGAFLIGHSLGTTLTSHFLRNFPDSVAGTLSIDPISVLPYIPDLVRSFIYSEPKTVGEMLIRVISREIGVATVIQRHFHWFEFVRFPHLEETRLGLRAARRPSKPTPGRTVRRKIGHHFILSDQDAIVNYQQVSSYLERSANSSVTFTTLTNTAHGGFLLFHLPKVVKLTLQLLNNADPTASDHPKPAKFIPASAPMDPRHPSHPLRRVISCHAIPPLPPSPTCIKFTQFHQHHAENHELYVFNEVS